MTRRLIEDDFTPTEAVIGEKVVWVVPFKDIYEAPTVDAEPVRHGYWIQPEFKSIWNNKLIVCSECGELFLVRNVESEHYCRNCGAKMSE